VWSRGKGGDNIKILPIAIVVIWMISLKFFN